MVVAGRTTGRTTTDRCSRPGRMCRWQPCRHRHIAWAPWWTNSSSAGPANTISRTSRSTCPVTHSSCSRGCRARASPAWPSTRSSPRVSAGTWSRCPPTPGSSSVRWTSPTSTSSKGCPQRCRSTRSPPHATLGPPSAPSPRSTTTFACCTPGPGGRTVRCADGRSAGRPLSPSSTGCSSSTRARGSRCSRPSCGPARESTETCSARCRPRATPEPGSTASSTSSPIHRR